MSPTNPLPMITGTTFHFHRSIPMKATAPTITTNQSTRVPSGNAACRPNQMARFRMTPTTAAVTAESAAVRLCVFAQLLEVRRAEKNPEEAGNECGPGGDERAEGGGEQRRECAGLIPSAHETDELQHHDERARRCLG